MGIHFRLIHQRRKKLLLQERINGVHAFLVAHPAAERVTNIANLHICSFSGDAAFHVELRFVSIVLQLSQMKFCSDREKRICSWSSVPPRLCLGRLGMMKEAVFCSPDDNVLCLFFFFFFLSIIMQICTNSFKI